MVRDTSRGRRLLLRDGEAMESQAFMLEEGIHHLEINTNYYHAEALEPLDRFDFIDGLFIIHRWLIDISAIHACRHIRYLTLNGSSGTPIDYTCFPDLIKCMTAYGKQKGLFEKTSLQKLDLASFKADDLHQLNQLTNLKSLIIRSSRLKSLKGIGVLSKLNFLGLYHVNTLDSMEGLENLSDLDVLDIEGCKKIHSIEPIRNLTRLHTLGLDGCGSIDSLVPIRQNANLTQCTFTASTNIVDGDLSPLIRNPPLKKVLFRERRHYTHRRSDFPPY
ncbi:Internalin-A precursor [Phycisphaerae bacterium RAS2]|nr:Internalin-A precursor [Phycisphaerae bacterium RAS2]